MGDHDQLCGTEVTKSWLQTVLQESFSTDAEIVSFHANRVELNKGYQSIILQVSLNWSKSFEQAENARNLVVKIPSKENLNLSQDKVTLYAAEVNLEDMETLVKSHNCEVSFYNLFKNTVSPIRIPKCFHLQKIDSSGKLPSIIMEDISGKGYVPNLAQGLSLKQLSQLFDQFADLHAWSLKNQSWSCDSDLNYSYYEFGRCHTEFANSLAPFAAKELSSKYAQRFPDIEQRIRDNWVSFEETFSLVYKIHEQLGMPPVLCHGDLWTNNIFLAKNSGGNLDDNELLAVIDWQFCHPGCAAEIFVEPLLICSTPEVRRNHTAALLKRYFKRLTAKMAPEPVPFAFDTLTLALDKSIMAHAALSCGNLLGLAKDFCVGDDLEWQWARIIDRIEGIVEDCLPLK